MLALKGKVHLQGLKKDLILPSGVVIDDEILQYWLNEGCLAIYFKKKFKLIIGLILFIL